MIVRMSILAAAVLLMATAQPARADGPGYAARASGAPSRIDHRGLRTPSQRFPTEGVRRVEREPRAAYGPVSVVRASLPRNPAVPMYNEPPAR